MKKYHVNFRSEPNSYYSKGENFEAPTPIIALGMFIVKYPEAVFLAMYCAEDLAHSSFHKPIQEDLPDLVPLTR